ncbi:hypothetical protein [Phenylobacterium sp.]|uniref:hypothetical protein n=1 Tax=Phenylobacterium sp. TaxID=1871053 RepID=UPI0035B0E089
MTRDEWLQAAAAVFEEPAALKPSADSVRDAREALVRLHGLAEAVPHDIRLMFSRVPNRDFDPLVEAAMERMSRGRLHMIVPDQEPETLILHLGAMLRAMDQFVAEMSDGWGPSADPRKWLVDGYYLIPRLYPRRAPKDEREHAEQRSNFATRVIQCHRILPATVGGYPVRLFVSQDRVGRDLPPNFGAGLFADLTLELDPLDGGSFAVRGVQCVDQAGVAMGHLQSAERDQCSILAFPELTIDLQLRDQVRSALQKGEHLQSGDNHLRIVVPGSWHVSSGADVHNVAIVYDGFGEEIAFHRKVFPYDDKKLGVEAIASGGQLSVLVAEDALIAIGVCRDFCEHGADNPYIGVDADFFLIVSYGEDSSMDGHLLSAKLVRMKYRAHSFVVQQDDTGYPTRVGYVLTPYDDPKATSKDVARKDCWTVAKP